MKIIRMSPCRKASKKTETANYILPNRLHCDKLEIPSCDDPWMCYVWDFIPMASRRGDPTLIALVQQDRAWLRNTFEQLFVTSNDDDDTVAPIISWESWLRHMRLWSWSDPSALKVSF